MDYCEGLDIYAYWYTSVRFVKPLGESTSMLNDAVFIADLDGRLEQCNDAGQRPYGLQDHDQSTRC
jgi:hypothetical protein